MVSWKWWLLIHLHAVPISPLPSAVYTLGWCAYSYSPSTLVDHQNPLLSPPSRASWPTRFCTRELRFQRNPKEKPLVWHLGVSYLFVCSSLLFEHIWSYSSFPLHPSLRSDKAGVLIQCWGVTIYATCKSILAAPEFSFHPNSLKQMKIGLNMAVQSQRETQMGVVWEWYPRQLCLTLTSQAWFWIKQNADLSGTLFSSTLCCAMTS